MRRPPLHIVIPTVKGREQILTQCIVSILGQTYTDFDIHICTTNTDLVVGNRNSPLLASRFLGSLREMGHKVLIYPDYKMQGPGAAVQQVLDRLEGDLVFRVDDDVILTPRVLDKLTEVMRMDCKIAAVGCPVNGFGATFVNYQKYWEETANQPHLVGNGNYEKMNDNFQYHSCMGGFEVAEVDFLSGYAVLFDRGVLAACGGYADPSAPKWHTEDWYAFLKLRKAGYRLMIRGDAIAFHHHHFDDHSHQFGRSRADEDKTIFRKFKDNLDLPKDRKIGRVSSELLAKQREGV